MVRFSCTAILSIVIVRLLIELDPYKPIKIDLIKAKLIFVFIYDIYVDSSQSLFIANNSLSFEMKVLISIHITPNNLNTNGVKLVCCACEILKWFRRFFSSSYTVKLCSRILDLYLEVFRSNTLTSKNAFWPVIQKRLALTCNLALSFVLAVVSTILLPVTGCITGSIALS